MLKLDIGCGLRKEKGWTGIDKISLPSVDIVCDIEKGLPFVSNIVDEIRCYQVLEHIDNIIYTVEEFHRVCKPSAKIDIIVPYWNRVGAIRDPTHVRLFSYHTFDHFTNDSKYPNYYSKAHFTITFRHIIFATSRKDGKYFFLYCWERLKELFANRYPDIYENTWLKIFGARHLRIILEVNKSE